ncbi:MAG: hypothetical protein RDU59_12270 [Thermodesulfobacteriota bacterium]|nr:hypothetical protein [Thermodesulfobacteriota bacterium]
MQPIKNQNARTDRLATVSSGKNEAALTYYPRRSLNQHIRADKMKGRKTWTLKMRL